jgi:hypothetical protein
MTVGRIARQLWWMNQEIFLVDNIPPWLSVLVYHQGMNNRSGGGHSSETLSCHTDMNNSNKTSKLYCFFAETEVHKIKAQ